MIALLLATFLTAAAAQAPSWYNGPCGISKYNDAGQGMPPPRSIVGGVQAREYEFPWQVTVQQASSNSHYCGGSIINTDWVLCAAHCMVGENPNQVEIVGGEWDRSATVSAVRQRKAVAEIVVHNAYNANTMENDISLIRVTTPFTFNADVQPVCAPVTGNDYAGDMSVCSGWGTVSSGGACCPNILRYVSLDTKTNTYCNGEYGAGTITADMICASDNNSGNDRDSCQGDSGGPLVFKDGNAHRLIGIVSWGIGCASGYSGVYTRVTYFENWILANIA